jgi:DNA-binding XRE family transcriptional regulator
MDVDVTDVMTPCLFIRTRVFGIAKQEDFGVLVGLSQPSVSAIEKGTRVMTKSVMDRIRVAAKGRGLAWNDTWFFEVPPEGSSQIKSSSLA